MKTTFLLAFTAILLSSGSLFSQAISLDEAIKKGVLTLTASGAGGHNGESLQLKLQSKSKKRLEVRIPAGQIFEAGDSSLQNLMVGKEETLTIESGKTRLAKVFGFCVESGDGSPGEGSIFSLGKMAEGNLLKLAKYLSDNNLHKNPAAQSAVWTLSDNSPLAGINDPKLVKFVADLLGKPVPEYNIVYGNPLPGGESRMLSSGPADTREAFAMNGLFYYDLPKEQQVTFGLYDAEGKLVTAMFSNRKQLKGYHKFRFEFEIRNLPKGTYTARLTSEGKVIKELEVEF